MAKKRTPKKSDIPKLDNILDRIKALVLQERVVPTKHYNEQARDRNILIGDTIHVLLNGYHEQKKDKPRPEHNNWNYAIRGKTIDGRDIRVIISLSGGAGLLITIFKVTLFGEDE